MALRDKDVRLLAKKSGDSDLGGDVTHLCGTDDAGQLQDRVPTWTIFHANFMSGLTQSARVCPACMN